MTVQDLKKQIEQLKRENARLKAAQTPDEYSVHRDTYKGHPILVFEGPTLLRPLSLGLGKLKAVHACHEEISDFLRDHSPAPAEVDEDDEELDPEDLFDEPRTM